MSDIVDLLKERKAIGEKFGIATPTIDRIIAEIESLRSRLSAAEEALEEIVEAFKTDSAEVMFDIARSTLSRGKDQR